MMIPLFFELAELWPESVLYCGFFIILFGPPAYANYLMAVYRKKPNTREGAWVKKHSDSLASIVVLYPIFLTCFLVFELAALDPQGTWYMLQEQSIMIGINLLAGLAVALFAAIFRRRK